MDASLQNDKRKLVQFSGSTAESILSLAQAANEVQKSSEFTATQDDAIEAHKRILRLITDLADTCYDSNWLL